MYDLKFLPAALQDMTEIVRYISHDLDNKIAANSLAEKLISSAENLREFPYSCPVYQPIRQLSNEYRKCTVQNYLMFYNVDEPQKLITVYRVVYGKRDINGIL